MDHSRSAIPEATVDSVEVKVTFPYGETKFCEISLEDTTVEQEKDRLLMGADVDYGPPHEYKMMMVSPQEVERLMVDGEPIITYVNYLAMGHSIKIVKKQVDNVKDLFASGFGVHVKQ